MVLVEVIFTWSVPRLLSLKWTATGKAVSENFLKRTKRENMWRWGHWSKLWAWTLNENKWSLHHHRISYFNDEIRRIYWSLCVSNTNVFLYVWHQTIFLLSSIVKRSQNSLLFFSSFHIFIIFQNFPPSTKCTLKVPCLLNIMEKPNILVIIISDMI